MDPKVRKHLSVFIGVTVIGFVTGYLCMRCVRDAADTLSFSAFSTLTFIVPCAIMLIASFFIAATADEIGRQFYIVILVICLVAGIISMFVTNNWLTQDDIVAKLLANSPDGTVILPTLQAPVTMLRDIAAFVVAPTVGSIAGAWVGSRLHPMTGEKHKNKKKKRK